LMSTLSCEKTFPGHRLSWCLPTTMLSDGWSSH